MSLSVSDFARLRPFLYHLTTHENIARIRSTARLESAEQLLIRAERTNSLKARRVGHMLVNVEGHSIRLGHQDFLHAGAIAFDAGWDLEKLIGYINHHVFFWPGSAKGPIDSGRNHFEHFASRRPVLLRVGFYQLLLANPGIEPRFCRFNSGAPRVVNGRKSPRGRSTFCGAESFSGLPSDVVEVVFEQRVTLPSATQMGYSYDGPWSSLAAAVTAPRVGA